ncbi:MAG: hypothetical protein WC637_18935 [Victivallales bacterium]|jgi:hypothetical protein
MNASLNNAEAFDYPEFNSETPFHLIRSALAPYLKNEYPFQYFDSLYDSSLYSYYLVSKHHELEKACEFIWKSFPSDLTNCRPTSLRKYKDALRNIVSNLVRDFGRSKVVAVSLRESGLSNLKKYKINFAHQIIKMIHTLDSFGWLHMAIGHHKGLKTRIWMSEKMLPLFFSIRPAYDIYEEIKERIELRDCGKNKISYQDTADIIKRRNLLDNYTKMMEGHSVEYTPQMKTINTFVKAKTTEEETHTNEEQKDQERRRREEQIPILAGKLPKSMIGNNLLCIYNRGNKGFKCGGRFYSRGHGHQGLKKAERKTITIDGANTVELDFNWLHPSMAYAKVGQQLYSDPYLISGIEELRPLIKHMLLVAFNAKNDNQALRSIRLFIFDKERETDISQEDMEMLDAFHRLNPNLKGLLQELKEKHKPIKDYICGDAGIHLMNKDSKIMRRILTHCTRQGIPCLPVHDSVIIQEKYENNLREVMAKAYKKEMKGFTCKIDKVGSKDKSSKEIIAMPPEDKPLVDYDLNYDFYEKDDRDGSKHDPVIKYSDFSALDENSIRFDSAGKCPKCGCLREFIHQVLCSHCLIESSA